jgi:hypothetical protein
LTQNRQCTHRASYELNPSPFCSRVTGHPEVETDGRGGATMSLQGRNTH